MEDNQGAMAVAQNLVNHKRTKHIDIKYHYIRESIESGAVRLKYCPSRDDCRCHDETIDGMGLRAID